MDSPAALLARHAMGNDFIYDFFSCLQVPQLSLHACCCLATVVASTHSTAATGSFWLLVILYVCLYAICNIIDMMVWSSWLPSWDFMTRAWLASMIWAVCMVKVRGRLHDRLGGQRERARAPGRVAGITAPRAPRSFTGSAG